MRDVALVAGIEPLGQVDEGFQVGFAGDRRDDDVGRGHCAQATMAGGGRCGTRAGHPVRIPRRRLRNARSSTPSRQPAALALDANQMIARTAVLATGRGRSRSDADDGHRPVRAGDARHFAAVIVAMQDQLATGAADHGLEGGGIGEALEAFLGRERRMVDQHDPAQPLATESLNIPSALAICPSPSVPVARNAGLGTRSTGRPAPPARAGARSGRRRRPSRAAGRRPRYRRPTGRGSPATRCHIDVVVAGNDGHIVRPAEPGEPLGRATELCRQRDFTRSPVTAIWSGPRPDIGHDAGQHFGNVQMHPAPPPVEVTGRPVAQELESAPRVRHGQVRIGGVRPA